MNYEIVYLTEKIIAGCCERTNNSSPDMTAVIGGVWQRFYSDDVYANIPYKINEKALGIYTDYESNETGDYTVMAGCEVSRSDLAGNFEVRTIPSGRYAKFVVKGHMQKAVAEFWQELWKMKLDRSFVCDFEEYQNGGIDDCEIHIYIGLNTDKVLNEAGHMKKELGIARCGLACCLCANNTQCNGCHADDCAGSSWCEVRKCCIEKGIDYCFECTEAEHCQKGILAKLKPHTFTVFAKKYGMDKLLECLENNEKRGIIYHREGIVGDYDAFTDMDELFKFIEEGKTECHQAKNT